MNGFVLFIRKAYESLGYHWVTWAQFSFKYLHSTTIPLDEPILDQRSSYIHELHSLTRRYT